MHNGTNIYKFNSDESVALNVLQYPSVATDNLLAYGADWSPLSYCGETCSFITSSFYENYVDIVAFLSPQ